MQVFTASKEDGEQEHRGGYEIYRSANERYTFTSEADHWGRCVLVSRSSPSCASRTSPRRSRRLRPNRNELHSLAAQAGEPLIVGTLRRSTEAGERERLTRLLAGSGLWGRSYGTESLPAESGTAALWRGLPVLAYEKSQPTAFHHVQVRTRSSSCLPSLYVESNGQRGSTSATDFFYTATTAYSSFIHRA